MVAESAKRNGNGEHRNGEHRNGNADQDEKAGKELKHEEYVAGPEPLFMRIGGPAAVRATVDLFYDKLIADTRVSPFFEGVDMDVQRIHQYRFMLMVFGGPKQYDGRTLYEAHKGLIKNKGLTTEHFTLVVGHLEDALRELAVPKPLMAEVMRLVEGTRAAIFKDEQELRKENQQQQAASPVVKKCCIIS